MSKAFLLCALALFSTPSFAKIVKPASAAKAASAREIPALTADVMAKQIAPQAKVAVPSAVLPAPAAAPVKKVVRHLRPRLDAKRISDWRAVYEEAKNLLVPDQKYLIEYEDEDGYGTLGLSSGTGNLATVFSQDDVDDFKKSVEAITEYRSELKRNCLLGQSSRVFGLALDKFALALVSFHRRALPIVGDISENNNVMVLLVNRTALRDATVLVSRYLQFKKQRFKDGMSRFLPADTQLVAAMVNVGKTLKVELTEDDWNRAYGLRESSVELISLWPRDTIFEATQKLADPREAVCVVSAESMKGQSTSHGQVIAKPTVKPTTSPAPEKKQAE